MAERITTAIYFITNFINDNEPLKWRLRTLSTNLVSYTIKDKSEVIKEIISLFTVAKNTKLVSDVNHGILIKELLMLETEEKKISLPAIEESKKSIGNRDFQHIREIKNNSRQETILSVIRDKREVMIKDISAVIKDFSAKTIQRELRELVNNGILRKTGEKRWSRYSFA